MIRPVGDGRPGHRGLPAVVMADQPGRHVSAVGPAGDGDSLFVHEAALFQRLKPGHHVLAGALAPVADDGAHVGVAAVVAAAVVRLENDLAARPRSAAPAD